MIKRLLFSIALTLTLPLLSGGQSAFEFTHFNQTTSPELEGNNFKCIAVARGGYIWAGSQYHGLVQYDTTTKQWRFSVELSDVLITDIKADQKGNIWVANAGRSGLSNGGSNIGGGVNKYLAEVPDISNFYTITGFGNLTSRNVRSLWIDKFHPPASSATVWAAQGTYISTNITRAGGFSVGDNGAPPHFTKGYMGLQVTPFTGQAGAGTPACMSVAGNRDEVWVFAQANFGRNQLLRYKTDAGANTFLGVYDNTNTPVLSNGFRANAMFFDDQERGWIGLNEGGLIIKSGAVWKTMNNASVLPVGTAVNPNAIAGDEAGNVYIGTNNGLIIYQGGPVDAPGSYKRVTTADGLPTNMINGIAEDTLRKSIVLAHNAGISFMKYNKKVNATLEWDFSFPKLTIKPKGVTADGVSRLYVKVRRNENNILPIKKMALSIKNIAGAGVASLRGKLKVATVTDQYSNEANQGTTLEVSRTDSTPSGDYYFWYVAPEDFSRDSISNEANLAEREDSIKVKVTYMDNSEDSSYVSVKVQRPALLIASGFKKIKTLLKEFKQPDGTPFIESDKFVKKLGLQINDAATMIQNVTRLIDGDVLQNEDKENSVQGLLESVRKMGFASTRVDFVGQGIGGIAMRAVQAVKPEKFFADGNYTYNNYGKGFLNKFIGLNVPNNGSPVFDLIKDMAPRLNELAVNAQEAILKSNPGIQQPYSFFEPGDSTFTIAAELIKKALMDTAGFALPAMQVKNHLIVTDADITASVAINNPTVISGALGSIINRAMMTTRDYTANPVLKDTINRLFEKAISESERIVRFINNYAAVKGINNFTGDGDMISSVTSQAANAVLTLPHITKITSTNPAEVVHSFAFSNQTVARKIHNILNTAISGPAFANTIPAKVTAAGTAIAQKIVKVLYDTTKIVTDDRQFISNGSFRPLAGNTTLSDTTIRLKFRVKDTAKLQYIFITFQDTMYTTISKEKNQEVMLKIQGDYHLSGVQGITAVGVYETTDSVKYYADTINTFVKIPDSIQGFRVTVDEYDLYDGIPYYPAYEIKIKGEWKPLPSSDTAIKITIEVPTKFAYDSARLAFDASNDGFSRAYFRFKTYRDTVTFECLLPQSVTAVNRTIVNGNFKDSATWSKGRPPLAGDSIIISAGHTIVLDSSVQVRSLGIDSLGTLTLNNAARQLKLGDKEDGAFILDNYGTLNISNGNLTVNGRVKLNRASRFNMTGGNLVVDGNTGSTITSLQNGLFLFAAAPQMQSFAFTGGTLQIIDPPIGVASQAISCPYNFGINSTLILGNGISLTASNNPNGFGGAGFPPQIGRLVLDAGTAGSNRQLTITQPLNVKGSFQIKTGSNLVIKAPISVTQ